MRSGTGNAASECSGCPGMGTMGGQMWFGMVLFGLLIGAAIATLVALTIFLSRRSRPPRRASVG